MKNEQISGDMGKNEFCSRENAQKSSKLWAVMADFSWILPISPENPAKIKEI